MRIRTLTSRPTAGGAALTRAIGGLRLRREGSRYRYRTGDRILNWGSSQDLSDVPFTAYLNRPGAVRRAIHKQVTWECLREQGVQVPEYTRDIELAKVWLRAGHRVIARECLTGSQGRGTSVYSLEGTDYTAPASELPDGCTYVKVFGRIPSCVVEYRVHADREHVFDYQVKRKRHETEEFNPYIRSEGNGWAFCRQDAALPAVLRASAVAAVRGLGLDFGAVDCAVQYRSSDQASAARCSPYEDARLHQPIDHVIYEVNTAPGLEGTTLENYISFVRTKLGVNND